MNKNPMPVMGQPVFIIVRNSMSEKVQVARENGFLNELVYYAANGIMVLSMEYTDDKMTKILINKGMKESKEEDAKSLAFEYNLMQGDRDVYSVFVNEADAQAIARQMNEAQRKTCKGILDAVTKCFHEYEPIIALCTPGGKGK
jgi:hypothetical protein